MNNIENSFRFALVIPPTGKYRRDDRCQSEIDSQTAVVILPPVDFARYASIIREYGYSPRIFDFQLSSPGKNQLHKELLDFQPDFMLVSVSYPTENDDFAFIEEIKKELPVKVLVKGGRSFWNPKAMLEKAPAIDYIFTGEVEKTLELFLLGKGQTDYSIPGLAYRGEMSIEVNPESSPENNLSRFPLPARDLLQNDAYINPATRNPMTVIQGHRGCPGSCIFCPAPVIEGKKVRFREIEDIIREIKECVQNYHIREFLFDGDTFTINKSWIIDLCRALQHSALDIQWSCNSRVDTIDEEMVREMKKAGCWIIGFGIESGSNEMLSKMGKKTTNEQAVQAVRMCQRHGIRVHTFYIIGLPWETEQTLRQTLSFARKLKADFFDINLATPLPGTPFYQLVQDNNLYDAEPGSVPGYSNSGICSFSLDNQTLKKWRKKMLLSLTFSPYFVTKSLCFVFQQGNFSYYTSYAIKRIKNIMGIKK